MSKVRRVFADAKYHHPALLAWVAENADWGLEVVRRPAVAKGWVRLPIRWAVARTFAWVGRCRRLTADRERTATSSDAFATLALIHLMLDRIEPEAAADPEFHYRLASGSGLWDRLLNRSLRWRRNFSARPAARGERMSTFWAIRASST